MKCKIKIERILYPKNSEETRSGEFCILGVKLLKNFSDEEIKVNSLYNTFSIKGVIGVIKRLDELIVDIEFEEENRFGSTYKLLSVCSEIDINNKEELQGFYGLLFGTKVAEIMGTDSKYYYYIKEKNKEELLKVKGIGQSILDRAFKKLESFNGMQKAYAVLLTKGLTRFQISRICSFANGADEAIRICKENPYSLVNKIQGLGFKTIDELAFKMCTKIDNFKRMSAAILSTLSEEGENGRSYLTYNQLRSIIDYKLSNDLREFETSLKKLVETKEVMTNTNTNMFALEYYYNLEKEILNELKRIHTAKAEITTPENWEDIVKTIEKEQGWEYDIIQKKAILSILQNNVSVITGKAGTGKTTIVKAMIKILKDYDTAMCCLAAKAAQRMREVTGSRALTIHKLLGLGIQGTQESNRMLYEDIVIVDEASMVNGGLFLKLLKKIKNGAKLIILGDTGQLTSIGNCSVFHDLLGSKKLNVIELTEIHRQAKKSAIITKSIQVRNQEMIVEKNHTGKKTYGELKDLDITITDDVVNKTIEEFKLNMEIEQDLLEVQLITCLKNRGSLSTMNLNILLQGIYNNKKSLAFQGGDNNMIFVGDKVINTVNNYSVKDTLDRPTSVFNGSIGIVKKVTLDSATIDFVGLGEIVFTKNQLKTINLGYAITIHSSQGSQWSRVVTCFDMSQYILLNAEMLYTAFTRGIYKTSVVSEIAALRKGINTLEQVSKQTFLKEFITDF